MRRRGLGAATALAILLGLMGCAGSSPQPLESPRDSAGASLDDEPQPSQATAEPTSEPTGELVWTTESFPGLVHAVIEDRGQLTAVGRDAEGLAAWTSDDGVTWVRHGVPDPTFIEGMLDDFGPQLYAGTQMGPLTRLGDTLFSIGTFYGPNDFYRPVGWRSPDGASWEFIESGNDFYGSGAVTDLTTFGDSLVAARAGGLIGPVYSLWTWNAETSWHESSVRSTVEGTTALITVLDAAVTDGSILAVGAVARPADAPQDEWPTEPIGWRSDDGERWTEVALPDDVGRPHRIAAAPGGGFSVLGEGTVGTASIWHTTDGSRWASTDLDVCTSSEACRPYSLVRAGEWVVATVSVDEVNTIWLSRDGMNWIRQQTPANPSPDGLVAELGGDLFVFANGGSPDEPATIVLRGQLPG